MKVRAKVKMFFGGERVVGEVFELPQADPNGSEQYEVVEDQETPVPEPDLASENTLSTVAKREAKVMFGGAEV